MKVICRGEAIEITEKDIQKRYEEMLNAYNKIFREGDWSDYGDCNRAIDNEITRRVRENKND